MMILLCHYSSLPHGVSIKTRLSVCCYSNRLWFRSYLNLLWTQLFKSNLIGLDQIWKMVWLKKKIYIYE